MCDDMDERHTRQHDDPIDCSVRGWKKLRVLKAIRENEDGNSRASITFSEFLRPVVYDTDCESDSRIFYCAGITETWYDGWEISGSPDVGPPELWFYQEYSSNKMRDAKPHSRLAVSVDEGKNGRFKALETKTL